MAERGPAVANSIDFGRRGRRARAARLQRVRHLVVESLQLLHNGITGLGALGLTRVAVPCEAHGGKWRRRWLSGARDGSDRESSVHSALAKVLLSGPRPAGSRPQKGTNTHLKTTAMKQDAVQKSGPTRI